MKRCPECRRDYYDDSLQYCLEDGVALVQGAVSSPYEPATAIMHDTAVPLEATTRAQIYTTEAEPQSNLGGGSERQSLRQSLSAHRAAEPQSSSISSPRAAKPLIALAVAIAVLLGGFFGYRYFNSAGSGQINSIAVLPFENRSGNPDSEYLSDGLSDSLIYRLTQLPNLKVSPTSSVIRYKGKPTDVAEIARELDVMMFCLDDGAELLYGPASVSEPPASAGGARHLPH